MATLALCSCCGIDPSGGEAKAVSTNWPPRNPPLTSVDGEHTLVRGYLKRLNNNSADGEEKWVVRWIELERQAWQDRPELLLSVYKSEGKAKRLNAVIFRRIKSVDLDAEGDGCVFAIKVQDTEYKLMARNRADCELWVETLAAQLELAKSKSGDQAS